MGAKELVSMRMAARLIDITPTTMQQLVKDGKLEFVAVGSSKLISLETLFNFSGASIEMLEKRLIVLKDEIAENMHNRVAGKTSKKKPRKASDHNRLTTKERKEITARYTGEHGQQTALAIEYGVSQATIWKVVNNIPNAK